MSTKCEKNEAASGTVVTSPDKTMNRYQTDQFKSSKGKQVAYEKLDFSIYKSNMKLVAFATSEDRIHLWIKAFYLRYYLGLENNNHARSRWEEQETHNDPSKCDKVVIHLSLPDNSLAENIVTITIFVSTGRIQIQGRFLDEWGRHEFNTLLAIVNSPNTEKTTEGLDNFISEVQHYDDHTHIPPSIPISPTKEEDKTTDVLTKTTIPESPREKSFTMVKSNLATLESDFTDFKQITQRVTEELSCSLKNKDKEIDHLKERINFLLFSKDAQQQLLSDVIVKQLQMEQEIGDLHAKCKKIQTNKTKTNDSQPSNQSYTTNQPTDCKERSTPDTPEEHSISPPPTNNDENTMQHYSIPTENRFEALNNETQDQTPKTITPKEKPQNKSGTLILCDSNGRYLDPKILCTNSTTNYIRCATFSKAKNIINTTQFTTPETVIIHCGTNDLEKTTSDEDFIAQMSDMVSTTSKQYPESRVIVSSLLPRKDKLNERLVTINKKMKETCTANPNVQFVEHTNVSKNDHLYDKKHLNEKGVKIFAKNLKAAFFNTTPKQPKKRNQRMNQTRHTPPKFPLPSHPHGLHFPPRLPNANHLPFHPYVPYHSQIPYPPKPGIMPTHVEPPRSTHRLNHPAPLMFPNQMPHNKNTGHDSLLPPHFIDLVKRLHGYIC